MASCDSVPGIEKEVEAGPESVAAPIADEISRTIQTPRTTLRLTKAARPSR